MTPHDIRAFFSATALLLHCEVIVSVSASLEQIFCSHLRTPPPASQGQEGWMSHSKEPFKSPVCNMPVCLSGCLLYVSQSACLPACFCAGCLLVYFFFCYCFLQPVCLQGFFLSACLSSFQPTCSTNYLSPCLLTCLPACQWIHMLLFVLSQQLDSIPTTTQRTVFTL